MSPSTLEMRFLNAVNQMGAQRDENGKIRFLFAVNWIVSVLKSENPNFDAEWFYGAIDDLGGDK